jgi:hypothetical protein
VAVIRNPKRRWFLRGSLLVLALIVGLVGLALLEPRVRHCSLRIPVLLEVRVIDASTSAPLPAAEVLLLQSDTDDPDDSAWREAEQAAHADPRYAKSATSAYGVTGTNGSALLLYYGRISLMAKGECPPRDWMPSGCLASKLWIGHPTHSPTIVDLSAVACRWYGGHGGRMGRVELGTVELRRR